MAKKGTKDSKSTADLAWRSSLENTPLNEDDWHVKVVFLQPASNETERSYINKFESKLVDEARFVIKGINKTQTMFMTNQLATSKPDPSIDIKIFEEASNLLKAGNKSLPSDVTALLIKHQIMTLKQKDIATKQYKKALEIGLKIESAIMLQDEEIHKIATVANINQSKSASAKTTKKAAKKTQDLPGLASADKKYNTELRVRGEEWRDKTYIDDYPEDGPDLYVTITGFIEADLPLYLIKYNIPLSAIVQVKMDPKLPPSTSKRNTLNKSDKTNVFYDFWNQLESLRIDPATSNILTQVAFISYTPSSPSGEDPAENVYNDISYLLYDVHEIERQHKNYLDNMLIINIKQDSPNDILYEKYTEKVTILPNECRTLFFQLDCLLNAIDTDKIPVNNKPSWTTESTKYTRSSCGSTHSTERKDQEVQSNTSIAEKVVEDAFDALCHSASHKIVNLDEEYKEIVRPIVIKYMNPAHEIVSHLHIPIDMERITVNMLIHTPIGRIWQNYPVRPPEIKAKCDYHLNALINAFQNENLDFTYFVRILFFLFSRKLYLKRDDRIKNNLQITLSDAQRKYLKRTLVAKPLFKPSYQEIMGSISNMSFEIPLTSEQELQKKVSDEEIPSNTDIFRCPNLTTLVTSTEVETGKVDKISEMNCYTYIEQFSQPCMLQALHKASQRFNSVVMEYVSEIDKIVVHFYNEFNSNDIFTNEWVGNLPTPVCIEDFFDFIYDENYSWIQEEEEKYDKKKQLNNTSGNKVSSLHSANHTCLENEGQDVDLLLPGSVKHTEHQAKIAEMEAALSKSTENVGKRSKKSASSLTSSSKTKTDKTKDKKLMPKRKSKEAEINETTMTRNKGSSETDKKPFIGYDLTNRKICFYGRDSTFFSKDGTKIDTNYIMYSPMKQEYLTLHIHINGSDTCLHKAIGNYTNPIPKICVGVRAKSKILLNFEEHIEEPVKDSVHISSTAINKDVQKISKKSKSQLGSVKGIKSPVSNSNTSNHNKDEEFTQSSTYDFTASWPNGLIIEAVREPKSTFPSYIRQHYLTPCSENESIKKEKQRCISQNGQVIKFKKDGSIEVLCPDSTYFNCDEIVEVISASNSEVLTQATTVREKVGSKSDKGKKAGSKKNTPLLVDKSTQRTVKPKRIDVLRYSSIDASGTQKVHNKEDVFSKGVLLRRMATDYQLGEVYTRRADGTNVLLTKDGTMTVTFPDKTRIISYFVEEEQPVFPEWTMEELQQLDVKSSMIENTTVIKPVKSVSSKTTSFIDESISTNIMGEEQSFCEDDSYVLYSMVYEVEHPNFATVSINHYLKKMTVSMQNNLQVSVDEQGIYNVQLDEDSTIQLDNEVLYFDYQACQDCRALTYSEVNLKYMKCRSVPDSIDWVTTKDSYGKLISVNYDGVFKIPDERSSTPEKDTSNGGGSNSSKDVTNYSIGSTHKRCRVTNPENKHRFFLLNRDMTGEHLEHRDSVIKYKTKCRWQPWCSVNEYDVFCGCQKLESIITPITHNESQQWIMESKYSAKPTNLMLKDLKEASDNFYSWMRPYPQPTVEPTQPPLVIQPDVPDVLVLRNLVPLHSDGDKLDFLDLAVAAILRFKLKMDAEREEFTFEPVRDLRTDEEKEWCQILNRAALRTVKKYKKKLERHYEDKNKNEDIKKTCVVKMPAYDFEKCEHTEQGEECISSTTIDTESSTDTEEREWEIIQERLKPSSKLQQFLKQHAEMKRKAEYFRKVLREDRVPPYFQNILGGASWPKADAANEQDPLESLSSSHTEVTSGG